MGLAFYYLRVCVELNARLVFGESRANQTLAGGQSPARFGGASDAPHVGYLPHSLHFVLYCSCFIYIPSRHCINIVYSNVLWRRQYISVVPYCVSGTIT